MTGYRRTADRELVGHLAYRPVARAQQMKDRSAVEISQSVERVSLHGHSPDGNSTVTVTKLLPSRGGPLEGAA